MTDHYAGAPALIAGHARLNSGGGIAGLLWRACTTVVLKLSASGAAISMMTDDGIGRIGAASDPSSAHLEEFQFTLGEGPGVDAYMGRRPVLVPEFADGGMNRWPIYSPAVHSKGVRAVFSFPLQVGAARLGVLDVFRDRAGTLTVEERRQAELLADVTVAALIDQHAQGSNGVNQRYLDEAVADQAELFQAQEWS